MSVKNYKLVVTVPLSHADSVRQAMGNAGAGVQGAYSHCSFSSRGIGRYQATDNATPFIGQAGQMNATEEERIEVTVEAGKLKAVYEAMLQAHPYEEVAYDLYTLAELPF